MKYPIVLLLALLPLTCSARFLFTGNVGFMPSVITSSNIYTTPMPSMGGLLSMRFGGGKSKGLEVGGVVEAGATEHATVYLEGGIYALYRWRMSKTFWLYAGPSLRFLGGANDNIVSGFSVGMHPGLNLRISDKVRFNFEIGAKYTMLEDAETYRNTGSYSFNSRQEHTVVSFPVLVGFQVWR